MNFFEHQDRARKQTKVLVFAFMLAVSAIVIAMNLVMLGVFGRFQSAEQGWFSPGFWLAKTQFSRWQRTHFGWPGDNLSTILVGHSAILMRHDDAS